MIDIEPRLAAAAARLPGPDTDATERARKHLLAAFAPASATTLAPATSTDWSPVPPGDVDTGGPSPRATPVGRRSLWRLTGVVVGVASLAAVVVVAGTHGRSSPSAPARTVAVAPTPQPSPLGGALAFSRGRDVYTGIDGQPPARLAQLPANAGTHALLAVSPDGARVAAVPLDPGARTDAGEVIIYGVATGSIVRLPIPPGRVLGLYFTGDSQTVIIAERFATIAVTDRARVIAEGAGDFVAVQPGGPAIVLNRGDGHRALSRQSLGYLPGSGVRRRTSRRRAARR